MSFRTYVFCDRCSQDQRVSTKLQNHDGRGWCEGSRGYAREIGWDYRRGEDLCPECQDGEPPAPPEEKPGV
jgi:hypothetical protein